VPVLGGTERFNKINLSHQNFLKDTLFDTGLILAFKGVLGIVESYGGKTVPLDERFFVGGDFTVRPNQRAKTSKSKRRLWDRNKHVIKVV
jgi:outer membrane protein insertion porin family